MVISGENRDLDSMDRDQIRNLISERVEIHNADGRTRTLDVLGVEVVTSIAGVKSISIRVGESVSAVDIERGAIVYALNCADTMGID